MITKRNFFKIGLLALALTPPQNTRAQVTVSQIAAGTQHSLFVKSDGSLWAMGENYWGQLGDGTGTYQTNVPELIVSNGVTSIAARGIRSFFLTGSTIWAMGDNQYGEFGNGTTNSAYVPVQVNTGFGLAAGYEDTLFLRNSGLFRGLYAMGLNSFGELGDGNYNSHDSPEVISYVNTLVFGADYVTAAAVGGFHSLFIESDGSLWAMGLDGQGQLGDGNGLDGIVYTNKPEKVLASGVAAVAAGYEHSLLIKSDTSLWAMGNNDSGEVGDPKVPVGSFTNRPTLVASNVTAVAAGYEDSLFIKSGGSLWAMGNNTFGQLGNGTFSNTNQPTQIVAAGVTAIAAGDYHSLFLESDGSLWGMGQSFVGQLGIPSSVDFTNPVQIIGPIVGNGGFESGDFLGWTRSGNLLYSAVGTAPTDAHSGTYGGEMGAITSPIFLAQTLNTSPGANYLLSCWLNCDGQTPNLFSVSWNGTTLLNETNLPVTGWTNLQFLVSATGTNTALQFAFRDDPGYIGFDDVRVVPLSQPVLTGVNLTGTNVLLNAANGQWNGAYVALTTTNLAQPMAQWTPLTTNLLDGSGNFTVNTLIPVNPAAPQRFYRLRLQ